MNFEHLKEVSDVVRLGPPLPKPMPGVKIESRALSAGAKCMPTFRSGEPSFESIQQQNYKRRLDQYSRRGFHAPVNRLYKPLGEIEPIEWLENIVSGEHRHTTQTNIENDSATNKSKTEFTQYDHFKKTPAASMIRATTSQSTSAKSLSQEAKKPEADNGINHSRQFVREAQLGHDFFALLRQERDDLIKKEAEEREAKLPDGWMLPPMEEEEVFSAADVEKFLRLLPEEYQANEGTLPGGMEWWRESPRPFTPRFGSIARLEAPVPLSQESLFRQLCVVLWLLEAMCKERQRCPIHACWSLKEFKNDKTGPVKANRESVDSRWEEFKKGTQGGGKAGSAVQSARSTAPSWRAPNRSRSSNMWHSSYTDHSNSLTASEFASLIISRPPSLSEEREAERERKEESPKEFQVQTTPSEHNIEMKSAQTTRRPYTAKPMTASRRIVSAPATSQLPMEKCEILWFGNDEDVDRMFGAARGPLRDRGKKGSIEEIEKKRELRADTSYVRPRSSPAVIQYVEQLPSRTWSQLSSVSHAKFQRVREENQQELQENLDQLSRQRAIVCARKFQAIDSSKLSVHEALAKMRHAVRPEDRGIERDNQQYSPWFNQLQKQLPECARKQWSFQEVLRKISEFALLDAAKPSQVRLQRTLQQLKPWQIFHPDIMAAIEFCREHILGMLSEEWDQWLTEHFGDCATLESVPSQGATGSSSAT